MISASNFIKHRGFKIASLLTIWILLVSVVMTLPAGAATNPTYDCGTYGGGDYGGCSSTDTGSSTSSATSQANTNTDTQTSPQTSSESPSASKTTPTDNTPATNQAKNESNNHTLFLASLILFALGVLMFIFLLLRRRRASTSPTE